MKTPLTPAEIAELFSMTAQSWRKYRVRAALSSLGITLGTAAVVAGLSVSAGAKRDAMERIETLGLDNIAIRSRPVPFENESSRQYGLTVGDGQSLRTLVPNVMAVAPVSQRVASVSGSAAQRNAKVLAAGADYQFIADVRIVLGRLLTRMDEPGSRVCLIGRTLAQELFPREDPVGSHIRINGEAYRVVGVIAGPELLPHSGSQESATDLNDTVLTSDGPTRSEWPVDEVWIRIRDGSQVADIGAIVEQTLLGLHDGSKDFDVLVPRALLQEQLSRQRTFDVIGAVIAALALLVGGVGIMNIMLTSVLERTREIGLRRSVGATRQSIALQFLTESLGVGLLGGGLGIVLGITAALAAAAYAGWRIEITALSVLVGMFASLATAALAGTYPAVRAANLSPVEALLSE